MTGVRRIETDQEIGRRLIEIMVRHCFHLIFL